MRFKVITDIDGVHQEDEVNAPDAKLAMTKALKLHPTKVEAVIPLEEQLPLEPGDHPGQTAIPDEQVPASVVQVRVLTEAGAKAMREGGYPEAKAGDPLPTDSEFLEDDVYSTMVEAPVEAPSPEAENLETAEVTPPLPPAPEPVGASEEPDPGQAVEEAIDEALAKAPAGEDPFKDIPPEVRES